MVRYHVASDSRRVTEPHCAWYLNKDGRVGAALGPDLLPALVMVEEDALPDVTPRALDRRVAIDVAQLPEAEPVAVLRGRLHEAVHDDVWRECVVLLVGARVIARENLCNIALCE